MQDPGPMEQQEELQSLSSGAQMKRGMPLSQLCDPQFDLL